MPDTATPRRPPFRTKGCVAVAPVAAVAVTLAVTIGPFASMSTTVNVSGKYPLAAASAYLRSARRVSTRPRPP